MEPTATVLDIKSLFHKSCELKKMKTIFQFSIWLVLNYSKKKTNSSSISSVKSLSILTDPKWYPARQSLRLDPSMCTFFPINSAYIQLCWMTCVVMTLCDVIWSYLLCFLEAKSLRDEDILQTLPVGTTTSFYFRDLGPQVTWGTVSPPRHVICRIIQWCFMF